MRQSAGEFELSYRQSPTVWIPWQPAWSLLAYGRRIKWAAVRQQYLLDKKKNLSYVARKLCHHPESNRETITRWNCCLSLFVRCNSWKTKQGSTPWWFSSTIKSHIGIWYQPHEVLYRYASATHVLRKLSGPMHIKKRLYAWFRLNSLIAWFSGI